MIPRLHSRVVFLMLFAASGLLAHFSAAFGQLDGACYYCKSRNPDVHYPGCPYYSGSSGSPGYDPPVRTPQPTQAELDARRANQLNTAAVDDIHAFERSGSVSSLRSAMEKLFKAAALLRNWSPHQARYLKLVNNNIAWCYNAYGSINYKNRAWGEAESNFRMAWKYNPDSDAYRGNIRSVEKARQIDQNNRQIQSVDSSARAAYARGNSLWDTGDWEKVVSAYEEALRLGRIAASMGGDPVWDGYQKALDKARANYDAQLAANEKMRLAAEERQRAEQAAAEQHRQEVATLVNRTREYTRRQTDLRDAVVNERKQQGQIVEVKNPFGVDAASGYQGQAQSGTVGQEQKAYDQLWALANHLKNATDALAGFGEDDELPDEVLARVGYVLQQGQNAINGGLYREPGASGDKLTPIQPEKMAKLRARMEKVVPRALQQLEEVKAATKKQQEARQHVETAKVKVQTAREEAAKATAKVEKVKAMPEPQEPEAKKKKSSLLAEALALEAAATQQVKDAEKSQADAEKEKGEAEVALVTKREALRGTRDLLNTVIAGGELPEEKNKGGNAPPPPPPPGGKP